ncbi:MAG: hypothetical protein ACFFCS_29630 [Candidatus Hodarchaeota archaeon]
MELKKSTFWTRYYPYLFVLALLTANYITGFRFAQWGIPHLGQVHCGVTPNQLSFFMALMAIITCALALISGFLFDKVELAFRKRLLIFVFCFALQGVVLLLGYYISTPGQFGIWLLVFSSILGVLVCQPFVFIFMLIPSKHRGILAGAITGSAYLIGNFSMVPWTFNGLLVESLVVSIPAFLFIFLGIIKANKFNLPDFSGENSNNDENFSRRGFLILVLLMFGVYFIDSFGFMRMKEEDYFWTIWGGSDLPIKLLIGIIHFIAALGMGYIYNKKGNRGGITVICYTFVGFALSDFLLMLSPSGILLIISVSFYCATVSFYTVNIFALWADCSSSKNVSSRASIGIGIGGWLSSFTSTALAEFFVENHPGLFSYGFHMMITSLIAIIFLIFSIVTYYKRSRVLTNQGFTNKPVL